MGLAAPLLAPSGEATYHENCPGCKQDQRNRLHPGIPYREFFYVWIVALCSGTTHHGSTAPRNPFPFRLSTDRNLNFFVLYAYARKLMPQKSAEKSIKL
ncbi:hypothetical protein B296_00027583 [Ensete ventricosum]|uniref:Uncharacterized protein n=1 Tax=Ensete ventricosum TaxID=4639 RepID=A0A426ZD25_ENSVE|nr:hypothetical protein B296_00027583 [Ensete ventricosum]